MKYYYISDGQNQIGPLSRQELSDKNITRETWIWYEGLSEWQKAGDIEELAELFAQKQVPPPMPRPTPPTQLLLEHPRYNDRTMSEKRPEQKKKSTKRIILCCCGIVLLLSVLGLVGYNWYESYDQQQRQYSAEASEESHPEWYLSMENKTVKDNTLTGNILNLSKYTTYKQIKIQFSYYDKNGKMVQSNVHTIAGTYFPQTSTPFKVKIRLPQGVKSFFNTKSYGVKIIGAEVKH